MESVVGGDDYRANCRRLGPQPVRFQKYCGLVRNGGLPWTPQLGRAIVLGFDICWEVGHNQERQGCQPSGHKDDLAEVLPLLVAAPMLGVATMQRAITLLTFETKQMHRWPGAPGRVANTSSPGGGMTSLVRLQHRRRDATH